MSSKVPDLIERITDMRNGRKRWTFTLEAGRGETYRTVNPILYGHSTYGRESCLCGQPQRVFVEQWDSWEEARADLAEAKKKLPSFKWDEYGGQATSFIPTEVLTRHLPDDDDY